MQLGDGKHASSGSVQQQGPVAEATMLDHLQSSNRALHPGRLATEAPAIGNPYLHTVDDHPLSGLLAGSTQQSARELA
eukprot:9628849-Alexandrium_andersonii.AAC.1